MRLFRANRENEFDGGVVIVPVAERFCYRAGETAGIENQPLFP